MKTLIELLQAFQKGRSDHALNQQAVDHSFREHIVFFDDNKTTENFEAQIQQTLKEAGISGKPTRFLKAINGFAISLSPIQADQLRLSSGIKIVEANQPIRFTPPIDTEKTTNQNPSENFRPINYWTAEDTEPGAAVALTNYDNDTASSGETLPYGVKAVWNGVDVSTLGNIGEGSYAFVIDSGVLNTTGDLNLNTTWSKSFVAGESPFEDGEGHGTHVAGTIAALANGEGVVGVAPGANVISLKVFNNNGGDASYATIIEAINYATDVINNNGLDKSKVVINMSLGGGQSNALNNAVIAAADQGIRFAIAAGNEGIDTDYTSPGSAGDHANVYTVSAVNKNYEMASWSNWDDASGGDDVDFAAPGVQVTSLYGDGLAWMSGTSMAAPHVAGLLLAGGVQAGEMVTANAAGYADPFALIQTSNSTPDPTPAPQPDPTPVPISFSTSYFGNAAAGSSSISLSSGSKSVSQASLESSLKLSSGTLDTNLNGSKNQTNATEGSGFLVSYNANIGDTISFSYDFNSKDGTPYIDFSFYSINGKAYSLAALGENGVSTGSNKGSFSHTLTSSDLSSSTTLNFAVGVVDALDTFVDSKLTVQNFSITGTQVETPAPTPPADTTPPTVALSSTSSSLIAGGSALISFQLSENSSDFHLTDISVAGGSLSNFSGSGKNYSAVFTAASNGTSNALISVASNSFSDSSGNFNQDGNDANNSLAISIAPPPDTTPPTVALSSTSSSLIAGGSALISFQLSENSSDFHLTDISVAGGSLSNFSGSGKNYSAVFTAASNGTSNALISVASNSFSDSSGNFNQDGNDANNSLAISIAPPPDTTPPTVALSSTSSSLIAGGSALISFQLSENSSDFHLTDISVAGGSLSNFSGSGKNYSAVFTAASNGTSNALISVASNSFSDSSGNFNQDGNDANNSLAISIAQPTPPAEPTPEPTPAPQPDPTPVPISFSTSYFGNAAAGSSSISLSSGSKSVSQASLESSLKLSSGTLDTNLNGSKNQTNATEGSGFLVSYNANIGDTISFSYDFNSKDGTPYIDFSFYSINGKAYSLAALGENGVSTGSNKGSFSHTLTSSDLSSSTTLNFAVGVVDALDTFVDSKLTVQNFSITGTQVETPAPTPPADTTPPTVALSSTSSSLIAGGSALISFQLSENSSDFHLTDISVAGGSLSNFSGSGKNYSAVFTAASNGTSNALISVASNSFSDSSGNFNQDGNDANNSLAISIAQPTPPAEPTPEPTPAPQPDPTPVPISFSTSYFGNAAAGSSSISLSSGSKSVSQASLESSLKLSSGTLDTNLNGSKNQTNATEGSGFLVSYNANIGDTISFSYDFNSKDGTPYIDFSFYSINGKAYSLAALGENGVSTGSNKGSFSHTLTSSDLSSSTTLNFAVGVVDALDTFVDSKLTVQGLTIERGGTSIQPFNLAATPNDSLTGMTQTSLETANNGESQPSDLKTTNFHFESTSLLEGSAGVGNAHFQSENDDNLFALSSANPWMGSDWLETMNAELG